MVPFAEYATGKTNLSCWKSRTVEAMVRRGVQAMPGAGVFTL